MALSPKKGKRIKKIIYEDDDEEEPEAPPPRDPREVGLERRYRNQRTLERNWTTFCARRVQRDAIMPAVAGQRGDNLWECLTHHLRRSKAACGCSQVTQFERHRQEQRIVEQL